MKLALILRITILSSIFYIPTVFFSASPDAPLHQLMKNEDFEAWCSCKVDTVTSALVNTTMLNSAIHDKLFYTKTLMDLSLVTKTPCSEARVTTRNKVFWGNHGLLYTDTTILKTLNFFDTAHDHTLGPNMLWFRELWIELDISKACKMDDILPQKFMIGAFPFYLGRGISLGEYYYVDPTYPDLFIDVTVDQYAWGALLSGGLIKDTLSYDLYLSINSDLSTSLKETNAPTQLQSFGTNDGIVRGAGSIEYIFAARCVFTPLHEKKDSLKFEPYVMHYYVPEQSVDFLYDAKAELTTAGFAVEYVTDRFECGFDCASNFGHQLLKGWDENMVVSSLLDGYQGFTYTEVLNVDPHVTTPTDANLVIFDPSDKATTKAITSTPATTVSNGQPIAGTPYYNSLTRFRNPRTINLHGYMWVGDFALWLIPKNLSFNGTAGLASGGTLPYHIADDPNEGALNDYYNGFIPLRELYPGVRVYSYYYLSLIAIHPLPTLYSETKYSNVLDTLSNLVFCGFALRYSPEASRIKWSVNPNILFYWQDQSTNTFDRKTHHTTKIPASKDLGTEVNVFFQVQPSEHTFVWGGASVFIPGEHYYEVQGKPATFEERQILYAAVAEGLPTDNLPLIGDSNAFGLTIVLGYLF